MPVSTRQITARDIVPDHRYALERKARRAAILASLGGVEDHFFFKIGEARVARVPEGDAARTPDDSKTSSRVSP